MKILSIQAFSIYSNGGGGRILRRLYEKKENIIESFVINEGHYSSTENKKIKESYINIIPPFLHLFRRWYFRAIIDFFFVKFLRPINLIRIKNRLDRKDCDIFHIVDHGSYTFFLENNLKLIDKQIWVSFHDHFATTGGKFEYTKKLWKCANRRLVISEELGQEYCKIFSEMDYEIITDGVEIDEISKNGNIKETKKDEVVIYFGGLLHIDYYSLFISLADSLDEIIEKESFKLKLILRGTQELMFLKDRKFETIYKTFTIDNEELEAEIYNADILYLPIKFTNPFFYKFSLSTKMVGYLKGNGAIFYHGPNDSAAANLLTRYEAAECCYSENPNIVFENLKNLLRYKLKYNQNAKIMAKEVFNFQIIYNRFWLI